jgi:hypothetical protein
LNTSFYFKYKEKENIRSLSLDLQHDISSNDSILFVSDSGIPQFLIEYYDPNNILGTAKKFDLQTILRNRHGSVNDSLSGYAGEFRQSHRLWVIYAHEGSIADHDAIHVWLNKSVNVLSMRTYKGSFHLVETTVSGI